MVPFFYISSFREYQAEITLDEDNSRHAVQVLRMKHGEALSLTDGRGKLLKAVILEDHKKKCRVRVEAVMRRELPRKQVTIAISLVKNTSRFEWFLEKATEVGVTGIIPLICERTEKQHFRLDRLKQILVSAMLQSQQVWLPEMPEPCRFDDLVGRSEGEYGVRFIAHCADNLKTPLAEAMVPGEGEREVEGKDRMRDHGIKKGTLLMIGPEGDFSPGEIRLALESGVVPVTLGETRLRTETAGIVGATLLCIR
jgi:16S rRNA (uracil1498-N3)-methyltransferase